MKSRVKHHLKRIKAFLMWLEIFYDLILQLTNQLSLKIESGFHQSDIRRFVTKRYQTFCGKSGNQTGVTNPVIKLG